MRLIVHRKKTKLNKNNNDYYLYTTKKKGSEIVFVIY